MTVRKAVKNVHQVLITTHIDNLGPDADPQLLRLANELTSLIGALSAVVDSSADDWLELAPGTGGEIVPAVGHSSELSRLHGQLDEVISRLGTLEEKSTEAQADLQTVKSQTDALQKMAGFNFLGFNVAISTAKLKEMVEKMLLSATFLSSSQLGVAANEVKYALDALDASMQDQKEALSHYTDLKRYAEETLDMARNAAQKVLEFRLKVFSFGQGSERYDGDGSLWAREVRSAIKQMRDIEEQFDNGGDDQLPALEAFEGRLPYFEGLFARAAVSIETDPISAELASLLPPRFRFGQFRLELDQAKLWYDLALVASEHRGEKAEIASAAGNLGVVHRHRGEWEEALAMHRKSLTIYEELGDRTGMASQYGNLGLALRYLGESGDALAMHRNSLAIYEELGDRTGMASQYGNLGLAHRQRKEWEEALAMTRKCLDIYEELGHRIGIAGHGYNLGNVLKDQGDWEGAVEHFRRSLALAEELGMPQVEMVRQALAEAEAHLAGGSPTGSD